MKIFWKTIYYAFMTIICLVAVLLIISSFPISRLPGGQAINFKVLVILSGSMEPSIKTGGIILVKPAGDYKIGDIVTFGQADKTKTPTTHRIYDIETTNGGPAYITKGDANNAPDTREIQKKDIIGKVLFSVPYLGYVIDAAKKPLGFAIIIIIPAAIIIYDEVKKIWREIKKKDPSG